jgi:hypothetical protein
MMTMLGFFPDDGAGDCVLPDGIRTQISARLSAVRMSFVFMQFEFVCFFSELVIFQRGKTVFRRRRR